MPNRIALDFAVINALGRGHWRESRERLAEPGAAAERYAEKKRNFRNTAQRCEEAGVRFVPIVFTAQGSMTKEAGAILHTLANAVAVAENGDPLKYKQDLWHRIALAIARHGASAIKRRRVPVHSATSAACQRELDRCTHLEM